MLKKRKQILDEDLMEYGYLPTSDGSLVRATKEELKNLDPNDFIWENYSLVKQVLESHPNKVHVVTYHAGDSLYLSEGWHIANRIGYHLTCRPVMKRYEVVNLEY